MPAALILWGVIHIIGGAAEITAATQDGPREALELLASNATRAELGQPADVAESVIAFHGYLIAMSGLGVIALAVAARRRPEGLALGVAVAVVVAADIGLIIFLVAPGHTPVAEAIWGPLLLAVALAGIATDRKHRPSQA